VPVEVFANAPATDPTLTAALASAAAASAVLTSVAGLPVADPTAFPASQWRGSFLDASGTVLERFVCTDSRTTTLTLARQAEDAVALPAAVWPVGTRVAHDLTAGAMGTVQQNLLHKWRRHQAATAQAIAASTFTTVTLDTLDFDSAGLDPGPANTCTLKRAGLYSLTWGGVAFNMPAAAVSLFGFVAKNGDTTTVLGHIAQQRTFSNSAGYEVLGGSELIQCAAGDALTLAVYVTAALSTATNAALPFLSVARIGD